MTFMKSMQGVVLIMILLISANCGGGDKDGSIANSAILKEGDISPDFTLPADDGRQIRLSDFLGKDVVIYFYPKDQTPGCTKEACGFRDAMTEYAKRGVTVFGVSVDAVESHQAFKAKENLNFTLLSDISKDVTRHYGVLNERGMARRVTFLVGRDGRIVKIFRDFDPAGNASQILGVLAASDTLPAAFVGETSVHR